MQTTEKKIRKGLMSKTVFKNRLLSARIIWESSDDGGDSCQRRIHRIIHDR